jgi:hypothetical protein
VEYYWVETYEEAIAAIELLKSHGGTICESIVISNDSEQYDIKYCFTFNVTKADWIEFGENPFDRYAQDVKVASYVFADEVTIDELVYSDIFTYNVFQLIIHKDYPDKKDLEFINIDTMECEFFPDELNTRTFVYVDGELVFSIASLIPYTQLSEDVVRDVISSLKVVK